MSICHHTSHPPISITHLRHSPQSLLLIVHFNHSSQSTIAITRLNHWSSPVIIKCSSQSFIILTHCSHSRPSLLPTVNLDRSSQPLLSTTPVRRCLGSISAPMSGTELARSPRSCNDVFGVADLCVLLKQYANQKRLSWDWFLHFYTKIRRSQGPDRAGLRYYQVLLRTVLQVAPRGRPGLIALKEAWM